MNEYRCLARVKADFFLRGIKGQKQYVKGQWINGDVRIIKGSHIVISDGVFLPPSKFDSLKILHWLK